MIRVVVVDDHLVVRAGLSQLLGTEPDIVLVGTAADGREAIDVVDRERPDVVLMDLSMPGGDGIEAIRQISMAFPECHVLVLTSFSDRTRITEALAAGADGYLLKHCEPEQIVSAVRAVNDGGSPFDPKVARVLLNARRIRSATSDLSDKEVAVLTAVRDGLSNKEIGHRLGVSERTVKAHLTRVFRQLEVGDRTQAAIWASRHLPTR